jgi:hypothetical protein
VLCVAVAGFSVGLGRCRTPRTTTSSPRPTPARPRPTRSRPAPSARTDTSSSSSAHARFGSLLLCETCCASLEGNRLVFGFFFCLVYPAGLLCCLVFLIGPIPYQPLEKVRVTYQSLNISNFLINPYYQFLNISNFLINPYSYLLFLNRHRHPLYDLWC